MVTIPLSALQALQVEARRQLCPSASFGLVVMPSWGEPPFGAAETAASTTASTATSRSTPPALEVCVAQ